MVKVIAPGMSLDASGTLADALVFSKWKGRNYIRERVIPANPKSGGQVGVRAMFKLLTQDWTNLTSAEKADWLDRAKDLIASNFNAFLSYNMTRWRNFQAPSKLDPATEAGTAPTGPTGTATPGVRSMTLAITDGTNAPDWLYLIFRSLTASFTLAFDNCIAVVPWDNTGITAYVDTPLDPGTYYYNAIGTLDTGLKGADGTEWSGTIS